LQIRLIGRPAILDNQGQARPIRGLQVWAVLARVLLSRRPVERRSLAADLFPDAQDPLAALRWCLASLRRALDAPQALTGDPIELNLPEGTAVDVLLLGSGNLGDVECNGEFLEGIEPRSSAQFSTWLLIERARIAGLLDERLRQIALDALAARDFERAIRCAQEASARNSYDEGAQILLVRSLVEAGKPGLASAHVEETERRFLAELGERPSSALRAALAPPPRSSATSASAASLRSLIEAGRVAVDAGVPDSGLELLRRAVSDADHAGEQHLKAEALLELGYALVHSVRGHDDEGACTLGEALEVARRSGSGSIAARALCELGYVDALAGRRPSAALHLKAGLEIGTTVGRVAKIHGVTALNLFDWGRLDEGLAAYGLSLSAAVEEQDWRAEIWSHGVAGWGLITANRPHDALQCLDRCLMLLDRSNWIAFRPFPVALRAEARLRLGESPQVVVTELEQAFALSCHLRDPCWEGAVARAIGLCAMASDKLALAAEWMASAHNSCTRETDVFVALLVQIQMDRVELYRRMGQTEQAEWATREVLALAARTHADHQLLRAVGWLKPAAGSPGVTAATSF
jgi:DNA-binding SARP family transcriptional activator